MFGFPKWLLAGVVAASVGGAVWVALAYFLSVEVGYLARGIGFLAGVGVRFAAGDDDGFLPGAAAVIAAVAVIAFAKYMTVSLLVDKEVAAARAQADAEGVPDPPDYEDRSVALALLADAMILEEHPGDAETLDWPPGQTFEDATRIEQYPEEYRARAAEDWDARDEEARAAQIRDWAEQRERSMEAFRQFEAAMIDGVKRQAFKDAFDFFDLLWFGLAAFTAFGVGSGTVGDD